MGLDGEIDIGLFKRILLNASVNYRTFSEFEGYVAKLGRGAEKDYLKIALDCLYERAKRGERFFPLDYLSADILAELIEEDLRKNKEKERMAANAN